MGGKELVDFAVAHKLDFIEYDAGWYGHEYDDAQDARTVTPDALRIGMSGRARIEVERTTVNGALTRALRRIARADILL